MSFSNRLGQLLHDLPQFNRERRGDRRELAGGELAEAGGEVGKRGGVAVERGQRFECAGVEVGIAEACLGAGDGELLEGLQHLGRQSTAPAGAAFEFGAQVIPF